MQKYAQIAFGEVGLTIFFALCVLAGILIIFKGHLIKQILRSFTIGIVLISGLINFPVIDGQGSSYEQLGGYISWPLLWILDQMFGQPLAVKSFVVLLFIALVGWLLYLFNFSLPKININISQDKAPIPTKATTSRHISYPSTASKEKEATPHSM